jgi:hypothetical protein
MTIGAGLVAPVCSPLTYNTVVAGKTSQKLDKSNAGIGGALGDYLHRLILIPAATNASNSSIKGGSNSAITVFMSGTLADLKPIYIAIYARTIQGSWQVTTGTNVSVIAAVSGGIPCGSTHGRVRPRVMTERSLGR